MSDISKNYERIRTFAAECTVLLKSDGVFPLAGDRKIALFGNGARHTVKGGTGGGIVEVKPIKTIERGLTDAGFCVTSGEWLDGYDRVLAAAKREYRAGIKATIAAEGLTGLGALSIAMPEPDYDLPIVGDGDVAIYVLSRVSGEGADRSATAGDVFLRETEIRDIRAAAEKYKKFMLVLNVSGVVDLSPVVDHASNILCLSQLGVVTADVLADIISGRSYPSGKLASTWAAWNDYPKLGDFGDATDTRYREGIYVGYRYFAGTNVKPIFPFGHGLSYTTFETATDGFEVRGSNVTVNVAVTNTGDRKGKEIVQLYVSLPQKKLDQPYMTLAAFAKSSELAPGQCEKMSLAFDLRELCSFDNESCMRILEEGDYLLRVGSSSENTAVAGVIRLNGDAVVERVTHVGGVPDFDDHKQSPRNESYSGLAAIAVDAKDIEEYTHSAPQPDASAVALVKGFSDAELARICVGYFDEEHSGHGNSDVPGAAGQSTKALIEKGVPSVVMADGPAGLHISREYGVDELGAYPVVSEETKAVKELLSPETLAYCLKLFPDAANEGRGGEIHEQSCTHLPIQTALAQSWNEQICEECGYMAGGDAARYGVGYWLAPALNMHRSILCGRDFEYYSEDPLVCGKMGAATVRGAQKHSGVACTLKHFVCNEQETNRLYNNSILSERALRDIYLRAFEIAVKEGKPLAVMSSYNLLNGEHTAHRGDLMETVLRDEWGFNGMVMSDWVGYADGADSNKYKRSCASGCIFGGNDLMMPGSRGHFDNIMNALNDPDADYPLTRERLERCAARVVASFTAIAKGKN